jgi:glutathione S-transferase
MAEQAEWTLYYHGGAMKGRGEYIRLMFETAGVKYIENNDYATFSKIADTRGVRGSAPFPAFAVPIVTGPDGVFVSQTIAIMNYLGRKFGMYPQNEIDDIRALQVALSVQDFHTEGRACFHPKDLMASYYGQEEEAKVATAKFESARLLHWLQYFENVIVSNQAAGFVVGSKITYVDVMVFHILCAAESQFPESWKSAEIPGAKAYKTRLATQPRVVEYFASSRCRPFEGNSMM